MAMGPRGGEGDGDGETPAVKRLWPMTWAKVNEGEDLYYSPVVG